MSPLGGSDVGPQLDTWQSMPSGAHAQHSQPFDGQDWSLDNLMSEVTEADRLQHVLSSVQVVSTAGSAGCPSEDRSDHAAATHRTTSSSSWGCRWSLRPHLRHNILSRTMVLPETLLSLSSSGPAHQESSMR